MNKKRLPYVDDKFRNLICHKEEYFDDSVQINVQEAVIKTGVYLEPISKISKVKEDLRNWTEEGQRKIELEMLDHHLYFPSPFYFDCGVGRDGMVISLIRSPRSFI